MMRTMVDHAMAWAVSRGLQRRNPVHGQDEYKVATDFNFANRGKDRLTTRASSSAELEARPGCGLGCWSISRYRSHAQPGPSCELALMAGWERHFGGWRCWSHSRKAYAETQPLYMPRFAIVSRYTWLCDKKCQSYLPPCWLYKFAALRKGANTTNAGLNMAEGNPKGSGKGKKTVFPMLQVGGDPYSHGLRSTTPYMWLAYRGVRVYPFSLSSLTQQLM